MVDDILVRLIFTGLIAYVPVQYSGTAGGGPTSGLVAMMPETLGDAYSDDGCPLPEHVPGLFISAKGCWKLGPASHLPWIDLRPCALDPELKRKLGDPMAALEISASESLRGWQVSLLSVPKATTPIEFSSRSPGQYCPRTAIEEMDPSWIPEIGGMDQADSRCLSGAQCRLAARVKVRGGQLLTCHLLRSPTDNRIAAYRFEEDSFSLPFGHLVQAVADTTMLDLHFATPLVVVRFEALGDPDVGFFLLLTPRDGLIQLWAADLPGEIMDSHDACVDANLEKHDQIYYNVLARRGNGMPVAMADRPFGRRDHTCPQVPAEPAKFCDLLAFNTSTFGIGQVANDYGACGQMNYQSVPRTSD